MAATVQPVQSGQSGMFEVPAYKPATETKHELPWADLVTLDLSKFDELGGKEALAAQLFDAIHKIGFFYIINFGLTQEQVDRQFGIGEELFKLPTETLMQHKGDFDNGGYMGYKPIGFREIKPGIPDNIELYNIPKFNTHHDRVHPSVINENMDEIKGFASHIYNDIVIKLLALFAIILEVPEDTFIKSHRYSEPSNCHLRYMKYHARTEEQNKALDNVWLKGHSDYGSLTLLFKQPVAALQVLTPAGTWRWVKPYPESITVNIADALQFLTNGFLKSSIHRVVAPPEDQRDLDRLGVIYFLRAEDALELKPISDSPVLKRLGYGETTDGGAVGITAGEWHKARVRTGMVVGTNDLTHVVEQDIIGGKKAMYYD